MFQKKTVFKIKMIKFKNLSKLLTAIIIWIDIMKNKTN